VAQEVRGTGSCGEQRPELAEAECAEAERILPVLHSGNGETHEWG
jgi:hypothetical protein